MYLHWRRETEFTVTVIFRHKQECIPVGCILPACYHTGWVSVQGVSLTETLPGQRPPDRDPLDGDPPGQRPHWTETPVQRPPWTDPLVKWPVMHAGTETPRGQTNTCENITLPQTSFAGSTYWSFCRVLIFYQNGNVHVPTTWKLTTDSTGVENSSFP